MTRHPHHLTNRELAVILDSGAPDRGVLEEAARRLTPERTDLEVERDRLLSECVAADLEYRHDGFSPTSRDARALAFARAREASVHVEEIERVVDLGRHHVRGIIRAGLELLSQVPD